MKVKLSLITIDAGTQARQKINQDVVNEYAQLMADGAVFPPIIVFGEKNILADGWHRYFAHRAAGIKEIEIDSREGDVRDAIFFGFGANKHRGLQMNQADTKVIIGRMLMDQEWAKLGDRKIAEHVGVSSTTVLRLRQAMEGDGKLEKATSKTVVRNGKEFEVDVSKNQKQEEPVAATPEAVTNESHPQDLQEIKELSDLVGDLEEENQKLKDTIAIQAWDASDIEKEDIEQTVKDLREKIKLLEMENNSLRSSRDMYMNQAADLQRINKKLQAALKRQ
jgi:DNA-binding transcriptional regulator YhcF (GntR family)